ncbi:MAG: hypothetical protein Q9197_001042 [Variospora fuerteventurae]
MAGNVKHNLTYESKEPAFLRKLKSEYEGTDSARHQRPLARPKRQRDAVDEEDDEPVYVHEIDPNVPISKGDHDALLDASIKKHEPAEESQRGRSDESVLDMKAPPSVPGAEEGVLQDAQPQQQLAVIGAASKKRSVKVVGDDASATGFQESDATLKAKKSKQGLKKVKRPKLSFQQD